MNTIWTKTINDTTTSVDIDEDLGIVLRRTFGKITQTIEITDGNVEHVIDALKEASLRKPLFWAEQVTEHIEPREQQSA